MFCLPISLGGAEELGIVYINTIRGAKEPRNLQNHRGVVAFSERDLMDVLVILDPKNYWSSLLRCLPRGLPQKLEAWKIINVYPLKLLHHYGFRVSSISLVSLLFEYPDALFKYLGAPTVPDQALNL